MFPYYVELRLMVEVENKRLALVDVEIIGEKLLQKKIKIEVIF